MSSEPPAGEDPRYLQEQIITSLGNKRRLLDFIGLAVTQVRERLLAGDEVRDLVHPSILPLLKKD